MPGRHTASDPVGLILVHGIGEQEEGDTLQKFLSAVHRSFPEATVRALPGRPGRAVVESGGRTIRVYEAHWAPLLSDDFVAESFRTDALFEICWFPRLNFQRGLHRSGEYSRNVVMAWTALLVPLVVLLHLALVGVTSLLQLLTPAVEAFRPEARAARRHADAERRKRTGGGLKGFCADARARAEESSAEPAAVRLVLDRVVADVTNYVDSAAGAIPEEVPIQRREAAERIEAVVRATVHEAIQQDGCRELQFLAHSLGTLVTYRVLAGDGNRGGAEEAGKREPEKQHSGAEPIPVPIPVPITALYTIGSPLEKIRFIWPSILVRDAPHPAVWGGDGAVARGSSGFVWHNFSSPLDLVSGRLTRFDLWGPVRNRPAPGVGGLASAHVSYESSPTLLEALGEGLMGSPPKHRRSLLHTLGHWARGSGETLLLPAVFGIVALLGGAVLWFMAWGAAGLLLRVPEAMGFLSEATRHSVARGFGWLILAVGALGALPAGKGRAGEIHTAHFSRTGGDSAP